MKKLLIVVLTLVLALAFLAGCSNGEDVTEPVTYEQETEVGAASESEAATTSEIVGEWAYLGAPWYRFYDNGDAVNLSDGEQFTWSEDGSLDATIYESWSISGDTLTIVWTGGASHEYTRIE
ncbi:MAG: hypothetical protein FWD93_00690 [Coriobacteriia bacterium]|nr:hypothetical protein [Coriobacteriia bacterium]